MSHAWKMGKHGNSHSATVLMPPTQMHGALFEGFPIQTDTHSGEQLRSEQRVPPSDVQRWLSADEPPAGTAAAAAAAAVMQQQRSSPAASGVLPVQQQLPGQQLQQGQAEGAALFPLFVFNVGDAMTQEELLAYFR